MKIPGIGKLDQLIIGEIIGPYSFGVAMFTVLIIAATYLFMLTDYLVKGIPFTTVIELCLLFSPGILVKTFAMAMLLAGLLSFGRLSNDSEIIAMRAAGASMTSLMRPVLVFSLVVAGIAFWMDETLVPWAAAKSVALVSGLDAKLDPTQLRQTSYPIVSHGKQLGTVVARDFEQNSGTLLDATVIVFAPDGSNGWYLNAHKLKFEPTQIVDTLGSGGWKIDGKATLLAGDGSGITTLTDGAWPPQIPSPKFSIQDLLAAQVKNLDVLSMSSIQKEITDLKQNGHADPKQIRNLEYGYWNKIALPLAAIVYGLLGAPLGIKQTRSSTAGGFALAIGIIFGYITLANLLNVYNMAGMIPAWCASLAPVAIGVAAAITIISLKNR